MSDPETPHVVYHAAIMEEGGWGKQIVREQLRLLRDVGLGAEVRCTHVGHDRDWLLEEAGRTGVKLALVRSDPNVSHYETFPLLEVERLAKQERTTRPILYLHTKGASAPGHGYRQRWRKAMEEWVVRRWRENVRHLADGAGYDAVGFNWCPWGEQHFSGNFWVARPDWVRRLPDFAWYHGRRGLTRFTCEMWIGAQANPTCRAYSLGATAAFPADDGHDFNAFLPPPREYPPMVPAILEFARRARQELALPVGRVLEVGSADVNGSARDVFEGPSESYVGVDIAAGKGVDVVLDAERLAAAFPAGHFDTVVCCECLEHCVRPWLVVEGMRHVLRPGGHLWVSTPTYGFPLHRYPIDCYRFGDDAFRLWIYGGMDLLRLEEVQSERGEPVLVAVGRKPA